MHRPRKVLPNAAVRKRQKRINIIRSQKRGTVKLRKALTSPTNPDFHLFEKLRSIFRGKRKVIRIDLNHDKRTSYVYEYYIRNSKNSDFIPKTNIMDGSKVSDLRSILVEFGKTSFVSGARKFNPLVSSMSVLPRVESRLGFVPEASPYDKTFVESIPKGYFSYCEEEHTPKEDGFLIKTTTLFLSGNYDWLEAVICMDFKRRDRYFGMIKRNHGILQNREVPKRGKYSIVKSRIKVSE